MRFVVNLIHFPMVQNCENQLTVDKVISDYVMSCVFMDLHGVYMYQSQLSMGADYCG